MPYLPEKLVVVFLFAFAVSHAEPSTTTGAAVSHADDLSTTTVAAHADDLLSTTTTSHNLAPASHVSDELSTTTMKSENAEDDRVVFRRLVIANRMPSGANTWGLPFKQAEEACKDMIKMIHNAEAGNEEANIKTIIDRMLGDIAHESGEETHATDLNGHLLAIHSNKEFGLLRNFLARLPSDVYWTGGELVRDNDGKVKLTWTDGTTADAKSLGIEESKIETLAKGKKYCLAFNTDNSQWEARDCDNKLPYACLLHHRHDLISTTGKPTGAANDATTTGKATGAALDETTTGVPTTTVHA